MKELKRKITIKYRWRNNDKTEIKPEHVEYLEKVSWEHVVNQLEEGLTSGQLLDNTDDGVFYQGWWEVKQG